MTTATRPSTCAATKQTAAGAELSALARRKSAARVYARQLAVGSAEPAEGVERAVPAVPAPPPVRQAWRPEAKAGLMPQMVDREIRRPSATNERPQGYVNK